MVLQKRQIATLKAGRWRAGFWYASSMRILVYEDNLLWSSRFLNTLRALGHEPEVRTKPEPGNATVAIVNLGSQRLQPEVLVPALVALGVHVIGHAGHKEKDILELGRTCGCQTVATNSEITYKIVDLLQTISMS